MKFIKKMIRKVFYGDLDKFSQSLGYSTWNEIKDNTFYIFTIPPDAECFATKLPDKKWAVWNNEGHPPFGFTLFSKWDEAIRFTRDIFEKNGYPEENWEPEGFQLNDDVFSISPEKSKRMFPYLFL